MGITFTPDLYWDAQCDIVFKNVACMTGTIQRFVNTLNVDCRKKIFHVFVLPRVRYCLPVWDNMSTGIQSSLDRVLLRAIRVITNNHSADFNRSVHDNSVDYYLNTKISNDGAVNCTRSATHCKIMPLNPIKVDDGRCFQIATIRDWNDLPFNVTSFTDFDIFKN